MLMDYTITYPIYLSDENIADLKLYHLYGCYQPNFTVMTLFISYYFVLFYYFVFDFLPARGRKTDYIINMA